MELYKQTNFMLQRDQVRPGYSYQYDAMESASDSDFEDSEQSFEFLSDTNDVDINGFLGRAIAIWQYNRLEDITLFTPRPDDNMFQIMKYIEAKFGFNRETDKVMVLDPGEKLPIDMKRVIQMKPGSVIMVMPKKEINVSVEINQLNFKFPVSAEPTCTVHEVKAYIKRVKGIPIDQQDILYRDKALENCRRLYEYRVKSGTTMHVLIQVHFDILVNVETFWGKTYRLYIDKCTTSSEIIYRIFGRTFSHHGKDEVTVHELYVPIHVLIFQHNKRSLHWGFCLGFYGVKSGDSLVLNTVGRQSNMSMQTLLVITELGENFEVTVSQFDHWSVVAFILHGYTDVPVDLIRLYKKDVQLNFTSVVGMQPKNSLIMMNITMTNVDKDMMFGIPLKINIGNGIVENMKVVPSKKVKDVKDRLEEIGVPNASLCEIGNGQYKLPNQAKLQDVIKDFNKTLFLKVEKFPVFLHAPDGVIYKTNVDVNNCLKHLHQKIEMKSGHAISSCRLLMSGQELTISDNANLYENGISTRNSIFVEAAPMFDTFFITSGPLLIKLRVPVKPTVDVIKKSIWGNRDVPEGSITCLQTFFFWFFAPRVSRKYQLPKRRKGKKQLPAANDPLHLFSDRLEKKKRTDHDIDYSEIAKNTSRRKGYHPRQYYLEDSDSDVQTQRTWPLSLQHPMRLQRNVEDWVNATYHKPRLNRKHTRTPTRKRAIRQERKRQDPRHPPETLTPREHITPRWVDNLQRSDAHGVLTTDHRGTAYRTRPQQYYSAYPPKKQSKPKPRPHHQGDATNAQYFNTRRMFDKQELANGYESSNDTDTESDDSLDERPHIVLK